MMWIRQALGFLTLAAGLFLGGATPCAAARLHVVLACDSAAPDIGKDVAASTSRLEQVIRDNMAEAALNLVKVGVGPGARADRDALLRAIYALPVAPDDAVMVFHAGHGAFNPNRDAFGRPYGTYLLFTGSRSVLYQSEIRAAVASRRPRLSVVVLDCCNGLRPIRATPFAPSMAYRRPPDEVSPLFDALFFQPRGTLVLESSAPGQYSFVLPRAEFPNGDGFSPGTLFTTRFSNVLGDSGARLTWNQVREETQRAVSEEFRRLRDTGQLVMQGNGEAITQDDQTLTFVVADLR